MKEIPSAESEVRTVLEAWAAATRQNKQGDILQNHAKDLIIFDVLPPMKYESADSYRRSWGAWQPEAEGETIFDLEELSVTAGHDVAFAHSLIRCGGTMPDGRVFQDLVRATFCLQRVDGDWVVQHQHVSKPFQPSGSGR